MCKFAKYIEHNSYILSMNCMIVFSAFMATKPGCRTYYFYADTSEDMIRYVVAYVRVHVYAYI